MSYSDAIEAMTMRDDPYGRKAPFKDGDEVMIIVGSSARRYRLSEVERADDGSATITVTPVRD